MVSSKNEPTNCNVEWERNVVLVKDEFAVIYDCFTTTKPHNYDMLFHTPPIGTFLDQKSKTVYLYDDSILSIIPVKSNSINAIKITNEYFYLNGSDYKAPMIDYTFKADGNLNSLFIILPKVKDLTKVLIQKKESTDGLGLFIETEKGGKKIMLFKNSSAKEIEMFGMRSKQAFELFEE